MPSMPSMPSMRSFLIENGIVAAAGGITIGYATLKIIKSGVEDLLVPLILRRGVLDFGFKFVSELVTWIFIVLVTFSILNSVYRVWGISSSEVVKPRFELFSNYKSNMTSKSANIHGAVQLSFTKA